MAHDSERARFIHELTYLSGVELDGEAAGVPEGFGAPPLVDDGGEAHDHRGLDARRAEEVSAGEVGDVVGDLEEALGAGSPGVDDPLGDPLPVELRDLLDQMVILQKNRPCEEILPPLPSFIIAVSDPTRIVIITCSINHCSLSLSL